MISKRIYKPTQFGDYIERIWDLTSVSDKNFELIIPPAQYVNFLFERGSKRIGLRGVTDSALFLNVKPGMSIVGIRFYGYGWSPFFDIKGKDLHNRLHFLKYKNISNYYDQNIANEKNEAVIVNHINDLLTKLYDHEKAEKIKHVQAYYRQIISNEEPMPIKLFCEENSISYMSLNRRFKEIIGITPQKFARLIKFRKAFDHIVRTNNDLTHIGMESGYFDQAHFSKEFKKFMRMTPKKFARRMKQDDSCIQRSQIDFSIF